MKMKKILLFFALIVLVFIGLVYLSVSSTKKAFSTCEILSPTNLDSIDFRKHDSVLVAASLLYEGNQLKKIIQGDQYREAWATPVKVPIVFLDTLHGGLKVVAQGGGKQTHSLELESGTGTVYSLRSVTKNPEPLIPDFVKTLRLENIVVDGISAQHPYAALVVAQLSEAVHILNTRPELYFLPKQDALGTYNDKYGNRLFLLEYETDGNAQWTGIENATQVMDTEDLQELKLEEGDRLSIDENALVRARLFDLLIGDWDRHAKQWGWVVQRNGEVQKAIPMACDRDNAFFKVEGLVPSILSNKNLLPGLQNFESDIDYLPGLVMDFDRYFLHKTDPQIFEEEARYLQNSLTDAVLAEAFKVWPKEIYDLNGEELIGTIQERRDNLVEYAKRFKEVLDEKGVLTEKLKGSRDLELPEGLMACFECGEE